MSVNKNFVVKNGLEVNTDLILADADTNKVGIASTSPRFTLDVRGGIGATDIIASGVGTFVSGLQVGAGGTILSANSDSYIGINTANPAYLLDIRANSSEVTATYVQGGVEVTGLTTTQDLTASRNLAVSGISTFYNSSLGNVVIGSGVTALIVEGDTRIVGILTIGTSSITLDGTNNVIRVGTGFTITSDGIEVTAGISTFSSLYSDNATIVNINSTGISTLGVTNVTDLYVSGIATLGTVQVASGIVTATSGVVTYYGDGQYLDLSNNLSTGIGIETTGGLVGYGITFINFYGAGVSSAFYNSGVGIATIYFEGGGGGSASIGIGSTPGDAFVGVVTAGNLWYNTDLGRLFIYYQDDDSAQWVDAAPFNVGLFSADEIIVSNLVVTNTTSVSGIITASGAKIGAATTFTEDLVVNGDARITGILTIGTGTITLDGSNNEIKIGAGVTLKETGSTSFTQGLNVSGVVTATSFSGNLTGNVTGTASTSSSSATAYGLTGSPNIVVGFATISDDLVVTGNLTVNGTQTIINTSILDVEDINVGIASTSIKLSNASLDGAGITIYGISGDKTLSYSNSKNAFETNIPVATNELRVISGAEKITRVDGNTATINYSTTGSNIGLCTNPSGDVTLDVLGIPTTSDFDDYAITFAVVVTSSGTARTCTAVNLNGVSKTIKWVGGSFSNAISGVTTTNGYTIYNFTGINTVGSASTTTNYEVFGSAAGGFY